MFEVDLYSCIISAGDVEKGVTVRPVGSMHNTTVLRSTPVLVLEDDEQVTVEAKHTV